METPLDWFLNSCKAKLGAEIIYVKLWGIIASGDIRLLQSHLEQEFACRSNQVWTATLKGF